MNIESQNFGKLTVYLKDDKNKIGDGYLVTATKKEKHLTGFIDFQGKEIIPIQEMELEEMFHTAKYQDICFGFRIPDAKVLQYYHIKKKADGNYKWILKTNPFDSVPIAIRKVAEHSNFWIFEAVKENPEYAIYSVDEARMLTNYLDEISFNLEENPYHHFAYFCKYIASNVEEDSEEIIHTSLCGFIDQEGNFSSQILDTESETLYDSYSLGENSLSKRFVTFVDQLTKSYETKYYEKEEEIDQTIEYLFNNYNLSQRPVNYPKKAKIISFKNKNE